MSSREFLSHALIPRLLEYLDQERAIAVAVLSPDLKVLDASDGFRRYQADPAMDPPGREITELLWELVGSEPSLMEVLHGQSELFVLESINRTSEDGSILYLSIKALPLLRDKTDQGLLLVAEDTTITSTLKQQLVQDRNQLRLAGESLSRANEELRKLNRLKSLFLSIAAHDLRSPLTAMRGYTDLALKSILEKTNPDASEYLSIVLSLVDTLNRLISDFLDLDVIEQGNLKIRAESCDLNNIVQEVADVMQGVARRKGVFIETDLATKMDPIHADSDRMRQIVFNLLGNAVKYTAEGDRVLLKTDQQAGYGMVSVRDSGPGIPEADIPRLFDLYHRTEGARNSTVKGLGLGLFIVKSLVDLHEGRISVQSELGSGTEFIVGIPLALGSGGGTG